MVWNDFRQNITPNDSGRIEEDNQWGSNSFESQCSLLFLNFLEIWSH